MKIIFIIIIVMTLTGCAKDIDINPYSTIVRQLVKINE